MNGSQDINYALISALYANKDRGLYSDVYFPIIKYTIVQLFNKKAIKDNAAFYTAHRDRGDRSASRGGVRVQVELLSSA